MAFDPTGAMLDDEQPSAPGLGLRKKPAEPSTAAFNPAGAMLDEKAEQGVTGTLWQGAKSAARALDSATSTYTGTGDAVVDNAQAQQEAPKDYRLENFYADVQRNKEDDAEDAGLWDGIKNVGGAIADNPAGAGLAIVEQLPNSVPTLAGGYAGFKGGALAGGALGSVVPVLGTTAGAAVGGVIGGLTGMFIGNTAIETGHKAMAAADDGQFTTDEMGQVQREGAIKGGVITAIDGLTLGLGGKVASAMQRTVTTAMETATRKVLVDRGIDVADEVAVLAARQSPEISAAVRAAQNGAIKVTDTLKRRATEAGTLLGMESVGEGLGEYLGELAATGESDVTDAVMEAALSLGQSGAEAAWNISRNRADRGQWEPAKIQPMSTADNPNPVPIDRPDPNAGSLSRAANLLPAPGAQSDVFVDGSGNASTNRPTWVNPDNDPNAQSFGPGMDQQAARGESTLEGDYIPRPRFAEKPGLRADAVDVADAAFPELTDQRERVFFADEQGNTTQGRSPNVPPRDYVQGGRGMDQQTPTGKTYSNVLAAKNAISKAAQPSLLEVVKLGDKQFEVRPTAEAQEQTKPVLQNRDRSTPASITQMRGIAAKPDYQRVSISRDFANGAPVVEPGASVPANRKGRAEVVSTASGRKINAQYAVIEAADLLPSHDINGSQNADYESGAPGKSRAIAGNGRVTGISHAYTQGTAGEYRRELEADAGGHGISPAAIKGMRNPVLVRIMPQGQITQDIGDESNTATVSALSAGEQARNDAKRIDAGSMVFDDNGEISEATVRQFIQAMPEAERGALLDGGRPSRQAHERAASAVFASAYESDELVRLQAQATDPEARTVLAGLLAAASKMARLKGQGQWDIRGLVVEAAQAAVNATRNGQTLAAYAQQLDIERNPEATYFIDLFAANSRSGKRIGEELSAIADTFYAEASKAEADMFGAVPRRNRQELLGESNGAAEGQPGSAQPTGQPAGSAAIEASGPAAAANDSEQASAGADAQAETFQLNQQTEEELAAADAANKARIKAEEKAQAEADEKQRKADEQAQIKAQSEAQADNFTLGVNADDSLSGQSGMFDSQPSLTELGGKPDVSAKNVIPAQPKQTPTAEPDPRKVAATKPEKTKPQATPTAKVEDFGEKIGGARKDTSTPGKRKAAKGTDSRPAWQRRYEITQVVTSTAPGEAGRWVISDKRKLDWKKQPKQLRGNYATEEEAVQMLPVIAVAQKHRVLSVRDGDGTGFEIWRDVTDRKRVKVVDQVFPSREAGMEYMAKNAEAIIETNTTFGEADLPRPDSTLRQGAERRTGPVKDSAFTEAFGFRGVEFGNWNNQEERQQLLDDAYDGLMDLAEVMGIPPRAISLNGDLALAFGARGQGLSGARAHYEPGKVVINLTKLNGAGSLAHEWFHALDHYFARQDGKSSSEWAMDKDGTRALKIASNFESDAASSGFLRHNSGVREVLRDAYTDLMKTMFSKGETYVEDTVRVDEFVGRSRKELTDRLDEIRRDLAEQKDPRYWKRNNKPASAEQLAEFDTVAQLVRDGKALSTELRANPGKSRSVLTSMRWTNDALEKMSEIYKAVRGRTGFNAETSGVLDRLRQSMSAYSSRLKMLADAQSGEEKVKKVPTQFAMDAKELDQGRGTDYWTTPHEMAARAFQGYVEDKIAEADGSSPFLNFGPENVAIPTPWGWKRPFPAGEERKAINRSFDKLVGVIQTRETEDGNVALFSRRGLGVPGTAGAIFEHDAAKVIIERIGAKLGLGVPIQIYRSEAALFAAEPAISNQAEKDGAKGQVHAVYYRGKVHVVTSAFARETDVETVILDALAHEGQGHYGIRAMYGGDAVSVDAALREVFAAIGGVAGIKRLAAKNGLDLSLYLKTAEGMNPRASAGYLADELLAHLQGKAATVGLTERAKAAIRAYFGAVREWLRTYGFPNLAKGTDADIALLLKRMREASMRKPSGRGLTARFVRAGDTPARFKRAAGIATAAFKSWFGASKVVNNQGEPKILYHGTGEDFTVFDQGRSGSSTRHSTAPLGIFLTGDRDTAQAYANKASDGQPGYARVMQLYAAIRNPYLMSVAESQAIDSPGEAVAFRAKLEREGYDGINLEGTDTWIAFSNTQVKSATDNNGEFDEWSGDIRFRRSARELFDRATGPAPLDRNDPFAAENRRLREDDSTLWAKAKKVFARQFAPGGLLPEAVFNEKITRDSEFQAVEFDVRHLSSTLSKAVKADYGVDIESLTPAQMKLLAEALAGRVDPSIPESTKVAIVAMRQYIDSLSGEYLSILQAQVEANMDGADQALIDKITGNLGAYVNRSYQAFDDPKWFKTVPTEVVNAARAYLISGYVSQGETAAEAARLADVTVNEMLKNGTAYDSMGAFIAEGKLGAKDLTVLIKRKEIAPEIRALLGEYLDPRLNFAKSATKMGRLVWNQRFLDRVLSFGMGTILFEGKNRPADATTQIAGDKSETYAPLNGLWTFPEVAQAFQDALGKEQMSDLYRTVVRLNGMVKYGKTILSPTTAMRNWQSAMFFSLANGHFDMTQMKKSWAALREQVTQTATGDDLTYLRKLKQLGVVYDTPYAGEMMALLQDARMDELLSSKSGTGLKWLRKANQFAQGFYSFGDDFWKIIGFENEKVGLLKAGIPLAEAEVMAAKRIRDTYPTYSMIGKAVQWLRRFPLAGTFVSFPSEIIRTSVNMLQITATDLKSDNPGLRVIGRKRAAGIALVSGGFYALAALTAAAAGVGDDEEEALRDLAAPWSKNSTFLYTGRDADGKLRYFDLSFLDPYGYWKRPLTAMMRDQPWEKAAASGLSDLLSPFFGADITAGAIFEVLANKKPTGGAVFNPDAGSVDQLQDIANHMRKALQPGFVSNGERLWLAGSEARREGSGQPYIMRDELVSLLGWRASTLDTQTGLYYRSFDFTDGLTNAKKTLTRTLRSSNEVSEGDIREAKESANAQYQQAFVEMGRLVRSAEAAGMSRTEIMQTLKLSGVGQRNISALMGGRVPPIDIGMQAQTNAVRQAVVMRDREHGAEIARRFRLAREE
ncbi:hypothetical protein SAMN05216206_2744 [Pseudomonas guineae]|uniref:Large polyvalent protein-associated domain-containing protein n=1 Tax=Pseudomonas guineae TaxID=425504 RepID=A0A1I3K809_9PSED|nr:LPD1 domain-containing protein [Pseudomonas guineae]SFI68587.1 hypothetical protein SAMN05216206_2744 [Pseudomonas guineae]